MKGIIGLFSLILICVMSTAQGLAPPGIDLSKPIVTVALETDAQLGTVNEVMQAYDVAIVVYIDKAGRDALIYQLPQELTPTPYCFSLTKDARDAINFMDLLTLTSAIPDSNIIPGIAARDCLTCFTDLRPGHKLPEGLLKIPNFIFDFSNTGLSPPYS